MIFPATFGLVSVNFSRSFVSSSSTAVIASTRRRIAWALSMTAFPLLPIAASSFFFLSSSLARSTPRAERLRRWSEISELRASRASFGERTPIRVVSSDSATSSLAISLATLSRLDSMFFFQSPKSADLNLTYSSASSSA